jgi:hypothetical protein
MALTMTSVPTMAEGPWWTKPGLAGAVLVIYAGTIVGAFFLENDTLRNLLFGSIIANATTVLNYFFGSSSSSAKKDDTIAASNAALAASTPAPVAPLNIPTGSIAPA